MLIMMMLIAGCASPLEETHTRTVSVQENPLIFYDWAEDIPPEVIEDFTREYGIAVQYVTYNSQEEAIENLRQGKAYDVVVLENQFIPAMIEEGLLSEIDFALIPNFKNISPGFIDLMYDPQNRHSIPYSWGSTGLVMRRDMLMKDAPLSWACLWDGSIPGKVGIPTDPRVVLGAALQSLGYSVNTENIDELAAAESLLQSISHRAIFYSDETELATLLKSGEAWVGIGYSGALRGETEDERLAYVLPSEGGILWGDNFVIPAHAQQKDKAAMFINFLLRADVSARIVNANYFATANEAARTYIRAEIINNPAVYPREEEMKKAELLLPLNQEMERAYQDAWERFYP